MTIIELDRGEPAVAPGIRVDVVAPDPILRSGTAGELDGHRRLTVVPAGAPADVVVIVVDAPTDAALDAVRRSRRTGGRPEVVLVCAEVGPREALRAVVAGARAVLRRADAHDGRLARAVTASTDGDCTVPADVLDPVLAADPDGPDGFGAGELTERERAVLTLVAEGHPTAEIARELSWSARTVTAVLHDVSRRWGLRNRAHAVAWALRAGLL